MALSRQWMIKLSQTNNRVHGDQTLVSENTKLRESITEWLTYV